MAKERAGILREDERARGGLLPSVARALEEPIEAEAELDEISIALIDEAPRLLASENPDRAPERGEEGAHPLEVPEDQIEEAVDEAEEEDEAEPDRPLRDAEEEPDPSDEELKGARRPSVGAQEPLGDRARILLVALEEEKNRRNELLIEATKERPKDTQAEF